MPQQTFAGVFHQVQHLLKAFCAAEIRIRHHWAVKLQTELGESAHLVLMLGWAGLLYLCQVVPVHDLDKVEYFKVGGLNLPCPQV